jgi:hypothetical protein
MTSTLEFGQWQGIPQLQRGIPQSQRGTPQLQRGIPQLQRDIPQFQRDIPQLQRDTPQLQRDTPQFQRDTPQNYTHQHLHPVFRQWLCLVGNILTGFTYHEKAPISKYFILLSLNKIFIIDNRNTTATEHTKFINT